MDQKTTPPPTSQVDMTEDRISADNPITKSEEDALSRVKPASSFARQVLSIDPSEGAVVGVLGPWGAGKTSFFKPVSSISQGVRRHSSRVQPLDV